MTSISSTKAYVAVSPTWRSTPPYDSALNVSSLSPTTSATDARAASASLTSAMATVSISAGSALPGRPAMATWSPSQGLTWVR